MPTLASLAHRAGSSLLVALFGVALMVTTESYAQQATPPAPPAASAPATPPAAVPAAPATQTARPAVVGTAATGVGVKKPVLQAACDMCPWGALGNVLKSMLTSYGYDVQVCLSCSGGEAARIVALKQMPPEISDRQFGEGTLVNPKGPIDFGVTSRDAVKLAYNGNPNFKEGPFKNLRMIANIESPSYLMVAVTKESGITDLSQVVKLKLPVRILGGTGASAQVLAYYGITPQYVASVGGAYYAGNALLKNEDFDIIAGNGINANNPEGNMWYEMSVKKDLVFLAIPEEVRQKMVKDNPNAMLVDIPFRYMRGVGDKPLPTVGTSGTAVYGTTDLPDQFTYDVAKALDEKQSMLQWAIMPFSYNPKSVINGDGVPLAAGAEKYYRERGYLSATSSAQR